VLGNDDTLLGKNAGCNLISIAFLVLIVGYAIYWFARGGDPQNKKLFDDCYRRETRQYAFGAIPDYAIEQAVRICQREQRRALGLNPD
jgi:hypothetical protein